MTRKELSRRSYAKALGILKNIMKQGMNEKGKGSVKNLFGRKKDERLRSDF